MTRRIEIDPVTRIEGHLRVVCELESTPSGRYVVKDAHNTATLFRGFEIFMRGRDPRDCIQLAQRICGVCPTPHAFNAAKAVEAAFGLDKVPNNARLVRNMLESAQICYDHILWFYQLNALDYIDVSAAAHQAAPTTPTLVSLQKTLKNMLASGRPGPFAGGWWGHPAYKLPPELSLELIQHYLDAFEIQAAANQAAAALGGKFPMIMNYVAGGVTHLPETSAVLDYKAGMERARTFIDTVMIPDLLAIAPSVANDMIGQGAGHGNYLTWGVLDGESQDPYDRLFPRGALFAGDPTVQRADTSQVRIYTGHSWYGDGVGQGAHPLDAGQEPIEFTRLDDFAGKYDWTQAARLGVDARPMEAGPLAQLLVAYLRGDTEVIHLLDRTLAAVGLSGKRVAAGSSTAVHSDAPSAPGTADLVSLNSTFGRIVARVLKAKITADHASEWADTLTESVASFDREYYAPRPRPQSGEGVGGWDAPRGALCHWVRIKNGVVDAYAAVPASNWNLSPRDDYGVKGPVEQALVGTPVADPERPLEILRVLHGFDP